MMTRGASVCEARTVPVACVSGDDASVCVFSLLSYLAAPRPAAAVLKPVWIQAFSVELARVVTPYTYPNMHADFIFK